MEVFLIWKVFYEILGVCSVSGYCEVPPTKVPPTLHIWWHAARTYMVLQHVEDSPCYRKTQDLVQKDFDGLHLVYVKYK